MQAQLEPWQMQRTISIAEAPPPRRRRRHGWKEAALVTPTELMGDLTLVGWAVLFAGLTEHSPCCLRRGGGGQQNHKGDLIACVFVAGRDFIGSRPISDTQFAITGLYPFLCFFSPPPPQHSGAVLIPPRAPVSSHANFYPAPPPAPPAKRWGRFLHQHSGY